MLLSYRPSYVFVICTGQGFIVEDCEVSLEMEKVELYSCIIRQSKISQLASICLQVWNRSGYRKLGGVETS